MYMYEHRMTISDTKPRVTSGNSYMENRRKNKKWSFKTPSITPKPEALHQTKKENSKNNKITIIRFHVAQNHRQIKLLFLCIAIYNFKLATIDSNTQLAAQHWNLYDIEYIGFTRYVKKFTELTHHAGF